VPGTESNWPAKHPIIRYFLEQDDPICPQKNQPTSFVAWFDAGFGKSLRRNVYFERPTEVGHELTAGGGKHLCLSGDRE
jgi:hypothetical protein